jgi:flagellar biosynthesis regulator FlaF
MAVTQDQSEGIGNATVAVYQAIERDVLVMVGQEALAKPILTALEATLNTKRIYSNVMQIIGSYRAQIAQALSYDTGLLIECVQDDIKSMEAEDYQAQLMLQSATDKQQRLITDITTQLAVIDRGTARGACDAYQRAVQWQ